MSDTPNTTNGAIDHEFDESERDARSILEDNLAAFAADVKPGDVVIDMVENRPLFVRRKKADTAVEFFDEHNFDLTTYKAHPWLPITPDDAVFETIFIPTKLSDIPTDTKDATYDYPRGRLARVPVEFLWDSRTRWNDNQLAALVAATIANVDARDGDVDMVVEAMRAALPADVVVDGMNRAGHNIAKQDAATNDGDTETLQ